MTVLTSGLSLRSDLKTLKTEVFDWKLSKGPTSSKIMTLDTKSKLGLMTKSKLDLRPTQFKVGFQIDGYSMGLIQYDSYCFNNLFENLPKVNSTSSPSILASSKLSKSR